MKLLSRVRLFTTPWTAAYQAPPSMGFSRKEYWSRVPLPSATAKLLDISEFQFFIQIDTMKIFLWSTCKELDVEHLIIPDTQLELDEEELLFLVTITTL